MNKFSLNLVNIIYKITKRVPLASIQYLGEKVYTLKNKHIYNILNSLHINQSYNLKPSERYEHKIWICWFQGEEEAPDLVKRCIASIREHCPNNEVIVLTDENINNYVRLPSHVLEKYQKGNITRTHFSDIVRMNLISQQGGMWVDATIFMTKKLPNYFFQSDFLSLRNTTSPIFLTGFWTGYFFYAPRGYRLVKYCANLLNQYWKENNDLVDYFLVDYAINKSIEDLNYSSILKQNPVIGNNRWLLHNTANKIATDELLNQFRNDNVGIYKLTYKANYKRFVSREATIYKILVEDGLRIEN